MDKRRIATFLAVGCSTVVVDFATYQLLLAIVIPLNLAKAAGFIIGTTFAYFANRRWTFGDMDTGASSVPKFLALYAGTLVANVAINAAMLALLGGLVTPAFVIATGCSATLNYLGMKHYVFRPRSAP